MVTKRYTHTQIVTLCIVTANMFFMCSTVAKLSKPSSSSFPLTKQSTSKSTVKTTPNTKKTGQKGVVKQLSAGKGTKAIAKTLNSVKAATAPKPPLIVSLPISSLRHSSTPPNASSTGSTPQPIGGGGKGGFSGAPAASTGFKKIKSVSSSSSDSSSSSSDSDSDDSSSHSSSSSDKEAESMDTAPLPTHPPPLPRMVDMSPSLISQTGSKVIQPKPIPSPVTVVSPSQLASLALVSPSGVPLLSPVPSSPLSENQKGPQTTYTLTTNSQGSFQLVPLSTTLSTASSKMLGSLTKSSGSGMSAFHVVTTPTTQHPPSGGSGSGALQ